MKSKEFPLAISVLISIGIIYAAIAKGGLFAHWKRVIRYNPEIRWINEYMIHKYDNLTFALGWLALVNFVLSIYLYRQEGTGSGFRLSALMCAVFSFIAIVLLSG